MKEVIGSLVLIGCLLVVAKIITDSEQRSTAPVRIQDMTDMELDDYLQMLVNQEDYTTAAAVRDEINARKQIQPSI